MTQLAEQKTSPLRHFTSSEKQVNVVPSPAWLEKLRKHALHRFEQVGFPPPKAEAWRHTNFAPITKTKWEPAEAGNAAEVGFLVEQFTFGREAAVELVFVNGRYHGELSRVDARLPRGVRVGSLAEAAASEGEVVQRYLAKYASIEVNPFVALNTGLVADGAYVHLPTGTAIEQPIHVLLISTGGERPTVSHPRVLVVAGDNVGATIVESYVGTDHAY
ncbi:MAG TPA: hypothetical protein VH475_17310, partial [Tepidisphaeraceae bacterium]